VLTPEQRTLRARAAAHLLHASGRTNTAPGTKAFLDRFEHEVDPEGVLDPAERARRSEHARKAYFLGLALKSSRKRSATAKRREQHTPFGNRSDDTPALGPTKPDPEQ
jgi:hypothetical protein